MVIDVKQMIQHCRNGSKIH